MRTIYKLSTHLFLAFARDEWNGLKVNVDKIRSLRNISRNVKTWKRFWSPMLAVKTPLKKTVQQYCLRLTKLKTRVLFNRRFSGEKSPTITVASFFSSDYSLIAYVPLFVNYSLLPKVLST